MQLDAGGENKTLVQDTSQGGKYIDPGKVISSSTDYNTIIQKAINGGVYIGVNPVSGDFQNPISDCTSEKSFYNPNNPAKDPNAGGTRYAPSSILQVDVKCLKEKIDNQELPGFNGVMYVDLNGAQWSVGDYDSTADGVMLVNGERLPDKGLSLATPNNVFIKGNYNLDPVGDSAKNRNPDDPVVVSWIKARKSYLAQADNPATPDVNESGLLWAPAEVITNRVVYSLSEDFPEPSYMPMCFSRGQQYYDETQGYVTGEDYVNGDPTYPTDPWVPAASKTISTAVNDWFTYYNGGQAVPATWTADWIAANWPSSKVFSLDKNQDGEADTYVLSDALKSAAASSIESKYDSTYSYAAVHGADSANPLNPATPSQPNYVSQKHIYNTAVVSPYGTTPSVLEYWSASRVVNGAFIQLPATLADGTNIKLTIPGGARYGRVSGPTTAYNYESRFAGGNESTKPRIGLTFGADSSWREIDNGNF